MNPTFSSPPPTHRLRRQAGFTLIELMVALAISLIVLIGFTYTFISMKSTFTSQDKLSQLQDNERLASTILSSSLQEAGYFPVPQSPRDTQLIPSTAVLPAMNAGQYLSATAAAGGGTGGETLSTAYTSGGSELDCVGNTVPTGTTVVNVFSVDAASKTLQCQVFLNPSTSTGTTPPKQSIVSNVVQMTAYYGLHTGAVAPDPLFPDNVDRFLTADKIAAGQWNSVRAVRLVLKFVNPNAPNSTIDWISTINLMNNKQ